MKHKLPSIFCFLAIFFLLAISSESRAAGGYAIYLPMITHYTFVIPPPIIPATTKTLSGTTTQYLSSISPDGKVFTFSQMTPDLQSVNVGDIVAGEVAAAVPNGFLRKIESVSMQGSQVIVATTDAVLEEAIQQGGFVYNCAISPSNVDSSKHLEGVTLAPVTGEFVININNVILYDDDGNPDTTNDQITANGSVELEPDCTFALVVEDFTLEELYFSNSIQETSGIYISSIVSLASLQAEIELARYYFAPITIPIGGWPVIFTPVLVVNVGMDGSIHAGVTASATQDAIFAAGLEYKNSNWDLIKSLTNSFDYNPPTLSAGLDVKAYASAKLSLLLYGVVGPDAEAQAYLELEADPLTTPWWRLYGGLAVNVGVDIEILSHIVVKYDATVLDYRTILAQASDGTGVWQEVGVGSASGSGISNNFGNSIGASIAISPNGTPYLAWQDDTSGNLEIYVRSWNGNNWEEVGSGSANGGGISNNNGGSGSPSLAIAPDGTPFLAWQDYSGGGSEIYVRAFNGSSWVEVGAGSASGGGISDNSGGSSNPSLAIAPDGTLYVAWQDSSSDGWNWEIYMRTFNGSNWVEVGTGSASGGGISNAVGFSWNPSLAIAPDGTPYVAWDDITDVSGSWEIYIRTWNGSSWVEVGVGSASGGGISNSIGASGVPSLAIAPDGTPYVAWQDDSGGNDEIYVRTWNGSNWMDVGVGSASGGGISNNVGASDSPSLAIAPDGMPYVVWQDVSSGYKEIYIRTWNAYSWAEVGLSSATGGGISNNAWVSDYPSIAISPDGIPYLAWQNFDNGSQDIEIYVRRYIE